MNKINRKQLIVGVLVMLLLVALFYFRPLLHPYIMSMWIDPLGTLIGTVGIVLLLFAGYKYAHLYLSDASSRLLKKRKSANQPRFNQKRVSAITTLGFVLLLASFFWAGVAYDVQLSKAVKSYQFNDTDTLPTTAQDRLVPLAVAERFAGDALQRPTEKANAWHPQLWDGKLSWVAPLTPDGAVRKWVDKAAGLQIVDASSTERKTEVIDQKFTLSEGVALTDNIKWQLYKKQYFIDVPEVYFGTENGEIRAIAPIISYKGFFIKHPVLSGAFIVSPDGTIQQLNVEQAKTHPAVISAGRLYPESYVRFVHESYALKNGLFNKWFRHVEQTEISDPSGENNKQPYMLATNQGLAWLSAADPWGQSNGVYKIFMTDAISGENKLYSTPKDSSLTGASQAIGYVKSAKPQYNWQVESSGGDAGGNILALEPRPVFVKNQLHWVVSVTNTEAKGVNETCFISAQNNQVTCVANDNDARNFLASGVVQPDSPQPQSTAPDTRQQSLDKLEKSLQDALKEIEALKANR